MSVAHSQLTVVLKWFGRVVGGPLHGRVKEEEVHWCLEDGEVRGHRCSIRQWAVVHGADKASQATSFQGSVSVMCCAIAACPGLPCCRCLCCWSKLTPAGGGRHCLMAGWRKATARGCFGRGLSSVSSDYVIHTPQPQPQCCSVACRRWSCLVVQPFACRDV